MAMDVCQTFLYQAKYGEFHLLGKPSEVGRNIQLDAKPAALLQSFQIQAKCGRKSEFVQHGWVQKISSSAYLLRESLDYFPGIFDRLGQLRRIAFRLVLDSRQSHRQHRQILAGAVVQVAGNSPALLVLCGHQSSGKVAQLVRLLKDLSVSPPQLLRAKLHLSIERISEGAKT